MAYRVGRAVGAGWLEENAATVALELAAGTSGLIADDGYRATQATIRSGLEAGMQEPLEPLRERELRLPGAVVTGPSERRASVLRWHGDKSHATTPQWLVKKMLLRYGVAIMSGQWSAGKTFMALELAYRVATDEFFAGRRVKRTGGTLFFAVEAEGDVPVRLEGLVRERSKDPSVLLPFAWVGEKLRLRDPGAADGLIKLAREAAAAMKERFGVDLALIVIDTMAAAAGFESENDAAQAQQVMNVLHELAQATGALVLVVDHFGKDQERGTRGSYAKEASADNILALFTDQTLNGTVTKRSLALRKIRGGTPGYEVGFELSSVRLGVDEDGDEINTCVVKFLDGPIVREPASAWKGLQDLKQAVYVALGAARQKLRPFGFEGPLVEATPLDAVRMEFYRAHPAEGDDQQQKKEARRKAFKRQLDKARLRGVVATRDIDGVDMIWLASSEGSGVIRPPTSSSGADDTDFG